MVNFKKLDNYESKKDPIIPEDIINRHRKPEYFNDLFSNQKEILNNWYENRNNRDTVIKLHTGGGKTLVGLLIAQSTMNELREPVLYLTPNNQLVQQTIIMAKDFGIPTVTYQKGKPLDSEFINGKSIMVASYQSLFNGKSKFGVARSGPGVPQEIGGIILDDAHTSFPILRESFTIRLDAGTEVYRELIEIFREDFKKIDRLGTYEDVISNKESNVLEVPFEAWISKFSNIKEILVRNNISDNIQWPLLRDHLNMCHALVSSKEVVITPILPLIDQFPSFTNCKRRIYMSATITDDSDLIRMFNADNTSVQKPLRSSSLAGISERMILTPEFMPFDYNDEINKTLIKWLVEQKSINSIILTPSFKESEKYESIGQIIESNIDNIVEKLKSGHLNKPVVFSNRYDGIDLPQDACRLLVMSGLPRGNSTYEMYLSSVLSDDSTIASILAQRIEQGMGRAARGSGDHCIVLLLGNDLFSWISKEKNFNKLTNATKAQLRVGEMVSKAIGSPNELAQTILQGIERDQDWITHHNTKLSEMMNEDNFVMNFDLAEVERKALNLWKNGYHDKAIDKIEKYLEKSDLNERLRGWHEYNIARISYDWNNTKKSEDMHKQAFFHNSNLNRPVTPPPYRKITIPGKQSKEIVRKIGNYRKRLGHLATFDEIVKNLHKDATSNQFEKALDDLGKVLGFNSQRLDNNGSGPDLLWLISDRQAIIIEAKSRKKEKTAFNKAEHGQLLVAGEWFKKEYPKYDYILASIHPNADATPNAWADSTYVLTYKNLNSLIDETRALMKKLVSSQLNENDLEIECETLLASSNLSPDNLIAKYFKNFTPLN
ncbi:MAG: DEAD/DEAH box helicase family protein [Mammaliicoccus sciuri]